MKKFISRNFFSVRSMKPFIDSIKKCIVRNPEQKKVLGRWEIDYCNKKINNKVDLSNEDHCGPCGTYSIEKQNITKPDTDPNTPRHTDISKITTIK